MSIFSRKSALSLAMFHFNMRGISGCLLVSTNLILVHSDPLDFPTPGKIFCWTIQCNSTRTIQCTWGKIVTWAPFLSSTTGWIGPHTQAIITLQQGGNSSFISAIFKMLQEWYTMSILQFSLCYKNLWLASSNKCISSSIFSENTVLNSLPHKHCALKNKEKTNSKTTHKNKQDQPPEEKAQYDLKRDYGGEVISHFL